MFALEGESVAKVKRCSKCKETKALSEFHRDRSRRDGRQIRCKVCSNADSRAYHNAHRETIRVCRRNRHSTRRKSDLAYYKAHNAARRQLGGGFVNSYLRGQPCTGSGPHRGSLIFHHPGKKNHGISDLVADGASIAEIKAEIALCVVLCRACHVRLHNGLRV